MPSDGFPPADSKKDGAQEPLRLGDRFEILPSQPLASFDGAAGPAFAARSLRGRKIECYAILCGGSVPPRPEPLATMATLDNPGLVKMIDHGMVDWNPGPVQQAGPTQSHARRLALVFERPMGRRLMTSLDAAFEPLSEDVIMRLVMQAIGPALKEMAGRGMTHGGIRPTNMILRDTTGGPALLGECCSTPPGYDQPMLFECIERAMAQPAGRGPGTVADDLYAFAVSLVILALGRNPVQDLDDEAVLAAKIERGSYAAIVGNLRIPQNLSEPVRGMMVDDPKQRWGITQLDLWLSGRRLSPKQTQLPKRAARPLDVGGQEVWNCRTLARAMTRNTTVATLQVESGDLDRWLRRGMSDDVMAEAVATAVEGASSGGGKSSSAAERMVTRVAIALDPVAPIRYKGKAVMPEGLGIALADAFLRKDNPQPLAEMVAWQMPGYWAGLQPDFRAELVPLVQTFETLRNLLEKTGTGFGIERVLYETNPHLHCLSPMVVEFRAVTPGDLLLALDAAGGGGRDRGKEPMDRHISAFLISRHRRIEDALFAQLQIGVDPVRRITAILTMFSEIQTRFGLEPLPNLCKTLAGVMEPTFTRFYNRPQREAAREQVAKIAADGKLIDLLRVIDNPEALKKDAMGFAAARREHKKAVLEVDKLRASIADREEITETTGRQVAATLSSVIGTLIAGALGLFFVFG